VIGRQSFSIHSQDNSDSVLNVDFPYDNFAGGQLDDYGWGSFGNNAGLR